MKRTAAANSAIGFTLLELVMVLVIIGTVLAMAAPSFRGWNRSSRMRDLANDFVNAARWARAQAVAVGQVHRISFDGAGGYGVLVRQGQEFVPVESSLGRAGPIPEGFAILLVSAGAEQKSWIDFHPTGRIDPGQVRIVDDQGLQVDIVCLSPVEDYRIVSPGEQAP